MKGYYCVFTRKSFNFFSFLIFATWFKNWDILAWKLLNIQHVYLQGLFGNRIYLQLGDDLHNNPHVHHIVFLVQSLKEPVSDLVDGLHGALEPRPRWQKKASPQSSQTTLSQQKEGSSLSDNFSVHFRDRVAQDFQVMWSKGKKVKEVIFQLLERPSRRDGESQLTIQDSVPNKNVRSC